MYDAISPGGSHFRAGDFDRAWALNEVAWKVPVRAENLVRGSGQQGCSPGRPAVMISDHVPAVRVPPDYAGRRGVAAVAA